MKVFINSRVPYQIQNIKIGIMSVIIIKFKDLNYETGQNKDSNYKKIKERL